MSLRTPPPPATLAILLPWLKDLYAELNRLDDENRKLRRNVELGKGEKLILRDPAGGRYVVDVNATGPVVRATPI